MLSIEALRKAAQTVPAVLVDSAQLLELLDAAERASKPKAPRAPRQANPDDEKCASWLYTTLLGTAPRAKQPNFATWAEEVRLMRERDGRTHREMCELFQWAHTDTFWRQNILSPTKLREHWDKLTIKRDAAQQSKPAAAGAWWKSEVTKLAKAMEVGVGPARAGESADGWEGRIKAAIDNGGAPPAPAAHIRPAGPAANMPEQRGTKPEGLDLRSLVRRAPPAPPAQAA
jgi:hypothetical protein